MEKRILAEQFFSFILTSMSFTLYHAKMKKIHLLKNVEEINLKQKTTLNSHGYIKALQIEW